MINMVHMLTRAALISSLAIASLLPQAGSASAEAKKTWHATFRLSTQDLPDFHDGRCELRQKGIRSAVLVKRNGKTIRKVALTNIPRRGDFCYLHFTFKAPKSSKLKYYTEDRGKTWKNTNRLLRCSNPSQNAKLACISVR